MTSRRVCIGLVAAGLALWGADWPQLLGPERNGIAAESVPAGLNLRQAKQLWKQEVGAGLSGPVVAAGRLILFHRQNGREIVESLDARTGARQWKFEYAATPGEEGPRATPTIAGDRVFTYGVEGLLHAIDLATGQMIWRLDVRQKLGVPQDSFRAAASPLVADGLLYLNAGGPEHGGIIALDASTGEVRWTAPSDGAGDSSPVVATIGGKRTVFFVTRQALLGADAKTGRIWFRQPWRSRTGGSASAALPVISGDRVFLPASYSAGAMLLDLAGPRPLRVWAGDESLSNDYATSVLKDGYLYGFHGRRESPALRCIEFATGKVLWSEDRFGAGTLLIAGNTLLVLRESGELVVAPASPKGFVPSGRRPLLPGLVRAYPALANGVLYLRNETALAAWSLTGDAP